LGDVRPQRNRRRDYRNDQRRRPGAALAAPNIADEMREEYRRRLLGD
jgi:hypothetical protein